MPNTEPGSRSHEFIICVALLNQFQYCISLFLTSTNINRYGITNDTLASLKFTFSQLLTYIWQDLNDVFNKFIKCKIPLRYFKFALTDYHCDVLVPLVSMYYSSIAVSSILGEGGTYHVKKYQSLMEFLDCIRKDQYISHDRFVNEFKDYSMFSSAVIDLVTGVNFIDLQPFGNCKDVWVKVTEDQSKSKILKFIEEYLSQKSITIIQFYKFIDDIEKTILVPKLKACYDSMIEGNNDHLDNSGDDADDVDGDSEDMWAGKLQLYSRTLRGNEEIGNGIVEVYFTELLDYIDSK
ncbi:hypothetical protein H4219_005836 [Mycoemilia scoparia]|uniref:Uncharacterized protein n=1 Tax=Mycoemilia scoparia TaxID=417184 RepID=A0A9W7ZSU8_9FUNG|nr:hypothetical protein H4219_005836 [Mycoemilia scoparia]